MGDHLETIKSAVIGGKHAEIKALVQSAVDAGLDPNAIINEALIPAMDVVGKDFGSGKIFVPEMLVSAVTMKAGVDLLKPLLAGGQGQSAGTVIMATVKGDIDDIGKNLVTMMLEEQGFQVVDLGVDLDVEKAASSKVEDDPARHRGPRRTAHHHHAGDEAGHRGPQGQGRP